MWHDRFFNTRHFQSFAITTMSTPSLTIEEMRARYVAEQAEKRRLREEEDARVEREFAEGLKRAEEEAKRQEEADRRIAEHNSF